jgi:ABC-type Fe3+-siderophore transport system, permease component
MSIQNVMATADSAARRRSGVFAGLVILVVLLALVSLVIGAVRLSPLTVIEALLGGGSDVHQVIVREIRLPRLILGLAIGAIPACQVRPCRGCCAIPWRRPRCSARRNPPPSARCW